MASTRKIKQVGSYVLLHDVLQGLYRLSDGIELSLYFDEDTKNDFINMRDDVFCDEARVYIELANI